MTGRLAAIKQWLDQYWLVTLTIGLVMVVVRNWMQWRRDQARIEQATPSDSDFALDRWPRHPRISVLVAAWNEAKSIDAHITSFLALDYPSIELIVCAGGDDDTCALARRYEGERVIVLEQQENEGKQRALARCFEHASGDIFYLTDADCIYRQDALLRVVAPLILEDEDVATGGSRPLDSQFHELLPYHLWVGEAASSARSKRYVQGLLGRNAAVSRRAIEHVGGLDFVAQTGTDYHLAKKLLAHGHMIRAVPASVVPTSFPGSLVEYRNKQSRWLRNLLLYSRRYGAVGDLITAGRTVAIGAVMSLAPLFSVLFGRYVLVAWALMLAQALASRVRYMLFVSRKEGRPIPRAYPAAILFLTLVDFVVWALPAFDILNAERRRRW